MKFEDILMWKSNTLDVISEQHSIEPSIGSLQLTLTSGRFGGFLELGLEHIVSAGHYKHFV